MRWPGFLKPRSIRGKLFIELTLLILVVSLFIYFYLPINLKARALEASLEKTASISELVAYSISPALNFNDLPSIEEVFLGARQNKDLIYIQASDQSGKMVRAFNADPRIDPNAMNGKTNPFLSPDGQTLHIRQSVVHNNQLIGKVQLGFSLHGLQMKVRQARSTAALVSLGVLIAGLLIVFGISLMITDPLRHLSETAEKIAKGDKSQRSQINAQDEVGQLSRSFNTMMDRLEAARQELEQVNLSLEMRVLERTKDLRNEIQERKMIEQELLIEKDRAEAANVAKSEFLASMSHELRTPLNAIIGFSQVLGDRLFGDLNDKQIEYIKDIEAGGEHLLGLINDILDLAKIEAGKMELELSPVEIKDMLEHCFVMVKEKCIKRRIALELAIAENLNGLRVSADARKLKQVMYNLLSNAAKFTPEGGRIVVEAKVDDKVVTISVEDTGVGIEPGLLEKIFEEFFQVEGGTKDKTPGTGLGLSLARKLVELHGGRIWAESRGPGSGSRFSFEIPIRGVC